MRKHFKLNLPNCQIISTVFFMILYAQISTGQALPAEALSWKSVIKDGKVCVSASKQSKRLRQKALRRHQPYTGYTHAIGYTGNDGAKIMYYHTKSLWDRDDQGTKIWTMAFQIAKEFNTYKFIQSGFYRDKAGEPSLSYFLKISIKSDEGNSSALLTFTELEGKVLYRLYITPELRL